MALLAIKLNVPKEVLNKYESQGEDLGKVLSKRLIECVDYTAEKPLYVDDKMRRRLDRLFGKNFNNADQVVQMMERYVTIRVGKVNIQLSPLLISRLRSRCFGKVFDKFLEERVIEGLEEFAMMR